jgi:hypothetical protein
MRVTPPVRAAQIGVHYRRDDLAALLDSLLPGISTHAETIGLYVLVCLIWGSILYLALAALQ